MPPMPLTMDGAIHVHGHIHRCCPGSGLPSTVKAGSQYDASLALRPLRCDKILKTDWSNATQLTQR